MRLSWNFILQILRYYRYPRATISCTQQKSDMALPSQQQMFDIFLVKETKDEKKEVEIQTRKRGSVSLSNIPSSSSSRLSLSHNSPPKCCHSQFSANPPRAESSVHDRGAATMASAACVASKLTAVVTSNADAARVTTPVSNGVGLKLSRASCSQQSSSVYGEASLVLRSCARRQGLRSRSRGSRNAVVGMSATTDTAIPSLNDLPLINYINQQGRIQPPVEASTAASVFAICDQNKKIQYIGFSKDVRNSLRLLMGRRPELCYFYKLYNLKELDQKQMLDCRQSWFSELGLIPPGNTDPAQRALWEQPGDAGSISERGRAAAAGSKAKGNIQMMVDRGLKEEMVYDPQLLEAGKCDVLPSEDQSSEELEQAEKNLAEAAARRRPCTVPTPNGGEMVFEICVEDKWKTNGGWIFDILVSKDDKETVHRVVVGKIYPDSVRMNEDDFLEKVMGFLLYKRIPRHTEGLLTGDMFPINYFAVSEVSQQFTDFQDWFTAELPDSYWRFNKIHSYGASIDEPPLLGPAFSGYSEP